MSNNVVPQPLMIPCSEMSQMETMLDSPMQMGSGVGEFSHQQFSSPNTQIGSVVSGSTNPGSQLLPLSNMQTGQSEPLPSNPGFHDLLVPNMDMGQMGSQKFNVIAQQTLLANSQPLQMSNNVGSQQLAVLNKRKTPMESLSVTTVPQNSSMPNKRLVQTAHRPWLQQISPSQRTGQTQIAPSGTQPVPQKKIIRIESMPKKPVPVSRSKKTQMQPSPKGRTESSDSVRSKMREQLGAALDLVVQQHGNPQTNDDTDVARESNGLLPSKEDSPAQKGSDGRVVPEETFISHCSPQFPKFDGLEFQSSIPVDDVTFSDSLFARDELLQGNGLSWVMDSDKEVADEREIQTVEKQDDKKLGRDERRQEFQSPKILASKIEAELFKLFGGVNKKYKEKGRSLLFNLKDRNNPELREKVMSGDLLPDRLCAMSAEELASKELSQWRQAKAEELSSLIVLPDSGVDMKRMVRKTHKGEFIVEFEHDENPAEDVSVGANSIILPKRKEKETKSKKEAVLHPKRAGTKAKLDAPGEKNHLERNEVFTIPSNDGGDTMQELMVDDALKDLPPIVSLDEFMDSLDSEPPFVNLPDDGISTPTMNNDELEDGSQTHSPQNPSDTVIENDSNTDESKSIAAPDKVSNTEDSGSVAATKPTDSSAKVKASPFLGITKGERVWEGILQLNISSVTSVTGIFKSGEKTSAEEWPATIEIKGRVRLDAFQKFLQELPMSRSRAIMVVHFCCKDSSSEEELENIIEVAASYISDGRVGFAEPISGVELYFCAPHSNPLEMLCKVLAKDQVDALNAIDNGLIGVIVWRKPHLNSTTTKKHGSKRQHSSGRRHDKITNINSTPEQSMRSRVPSPKPEDNDDDDDVPPGFGLGMAGGDDDDLPEFKFSGGGLAGKLPPPPHFPNQNVSIGSGMTPYHLHKQAPSRPMDQVRELIQKYGQQSNSSSPPPRNWPENRGNGFPPVKQWNDDDDDIPEWQPSGPPVHGGPRPQMANQFPSQQQQANMHMQRPPPPVNVMQQVQQQQRPLWGPPGGQFYGVPPGLGGGAGPPAWRQDAPKSRGF